MKVHANRRTPEYVLEMLGNSSAQHFFFFCSSWIFVAWWRHNNKKLDEDSTPNWTVRTKMHLVISVFPMHPNPNTTDSFVLCICYPEICIGSRQRTGANLGEKEYMVVLGFSSHVQANIYKLTHKHNIGKNFSDELMMYQIQHRTIFLLWSLMVIEISPIIFHLSTIFVCITETLRYHL